MKLSHAILGAGALVLAAAAVFPSRPAVVAHVDIEMVFAKAAEVRANDTKVKATLDEFTRERTRMSQELQDLNAELDSYKPGTPPYNDALRKVEDAVANMRAQENYAKLKTEAQAATLLRDTYDHVKAAAAALAKENKLDYVVVNDSVAPIEPTGMQGTKQQMALRRFLYATEEFDITAAVIARMDADFVKRGGVIPATPAGGSGAAGTTGAGAGTSGAGNTGAGGAGKP